MLERQGSTGHKVDGKTSIRWYVKKKNTLGSPEVRNILIQLLTFSSVKPVRQNKMDQTRRQEHEGLQIIKPFQRGRKSGGNTFYKYKFCHASSCWRTNW